MTLCATSGACELPPAVMFMVSELLTDEAPHGIENVHLHRDIQICQFDTIRQCR